jgi:hypothetical protein
MHLVDVPALWEWKSHELNKINQTGSGLALKHSRVSQEGVDELSERETSMLGRNLYTGTAVPTTREVRYRYHSRLRGT